LVIRVKHLKPLAIYKTVKRPKNALNNYKAKKVPT